MNSANISTEKFFINAYKNLSISKEREEKLNDIAEQIAKTYKKNTLVNLNFICTHNSRRSQLGQVWGFYAAHYFKLNINTFSGGTEVTAFFRNTVKTLQQVGFKFNVINFSHTNPTYEITFNNTDKTILGFSKRFDNPINLEPFIAITTCNNADKNCPFIPTASHRFHLPFVDPKISDDTDLQEETYLKTNKQIAAEVYFIFSKVSDLL